jgi:hypothetical protein
MPVGGQQTFASRRRDSGFTFRHQAFRMTAMGPDCVKTRKLSKNGIGSEKLPAIVHDHLGDAPLGLGRHLDAFEQRHDYRGMHVEGERRRRAALAQRLVGDRVIEKAGAGATPFPRDGQRQETLVAKALVIFDRVACIKGSWASRTPGTGPRWIASSSPSSITKTKITASASLFC